MEFSDDSTGFVSIGEALPDVILEIRYYSTFNFIGERIDGYEEPIALMTREGARALKAAGDEPDSVFRAADEGGTVMQGPVHE